MTAPPTSSDGDLVGLALQGESEAFGELYNRYFPAVGHGAPAGADPWRYLAEGGEHPLRALDDAAHHLAGTHNLGDQPGDGAAIELALP